MVYKVDYPNAEYHEILPNLFQGGHTWREGLSVCYPKNSSVSGDSSWDYVVSAFFGVDYYLYYENCMPQCDMRLVIFEDTEDGLTDETWDRIRSVVDEVVLRWTQGQKVLIRCQFGYNRSSLLTCLVLMKLGFTAEKAIQTVRERRGKDVLINGVFEEYVRERESEYLCLDNLDMTTSIMIELAET